MARTISQERLGELSGLDRQTIGGYELGRRPPSLDHLVSIAGLSTPR